MADLSEKVIEDILSSDKSILAELLSINPSNLSLIARQKTLPSGKLDLLYLYENELLLIELKVLDFYDDAVGQINDYSADLNELQRLHKLIHADIRRILLVTGCRPQDVERCKNESIQLLSYRPEYVLSQYYENFKELSYFLKIQSGDYGVVRLGLLNSTLKLLSSGKVIKEISETEGRSVKTIRNRLSVAMLLGLVGKLQGEFFLTDFGNDLVEAGDEQVDDRLNDKQVELLLDFVTENPFYSSITYTVFALVETVFILAKNTYPVPLNAVEDYFVKSVGKGETWRTERARETATYIFSNYACELQLLVKISDHFYITPMGIQAILLLQLHRSIRLIESRK